MRLPQRLAAQPPSSHLPLSLHLLLTPGTPLSSSAAGGQVRAHVRPPVKHADSWQHAVSHRCWNCACQLQHGAAKHSTVGAASCTGLNRPGAQASLESRRCSPTASPPWTAGQPRMRLAGWAACAPHSRGSVTQTGPPAQGRRPRRCQPPQPCSRAAGHLPPVRSLPRRRRGALPRSHSARARLGSFPTAPLVPRHSPPHAHRPGRTLETGRPARDRPTPLQGGRRARATRQQPTLWTSGVP